MILNLQLLDDYDFGTIAVTISDTETTTTYNINYTSNIEEYTDNYRISYVTNGFVDVSNRYSIVYDSLYGDVVNKYTLRYYSGREITDVDTRYSIKYTSINPMEYVNMYSVVYATTGPSTLNFRSIYRLRYATDGVDESVTSYTVRYSLDYFKDRTQKYYINYSSETPYMFETKAVLLRNNQKTSVLFYLKGRQDSIDDMLFVFSNLPRYQLVEFDLEKNRPHIQILDPNSVISYNLFGESFEDPNEAYSPSCYVIVENIEEINSMSLDLYEKDSLEKRNINKSFFFNLNSTEFYTNPVQINDTNYEMVNYTSNFYSYEYLNFVEKSVTPLFKVFDSCCFSTKIKDTSSNACSPF